MLASHLAACLRKVDANAVELRDNRVTFEAGMFRFVINLNVLVPFGFGDLTVNSETREVRYCLSYRQLVISSIATFGITSTFVAFFPGFRGMSGWMLFFPILWFFGTMVNLTIGISRFEGFIGRAVASAPRVPKRSSQ